MLSSQTDTIHTLFSKARLDPQKKDPVRLPLNQPKLHLSKKDSLLPSAASLKDSLRHAAASAKKSLTVKKQDVEIHGTLSNQFDYGSIPYYINNSHSPASLFKSQGDLAIRVKNIPLSLNYFYINPQNATGIKNYFNLHFDSQAYQDQLKKEYAGKASEYTGKLQEAERLKQQYSQKLAYYEMSAVNPVGQPAMPGLTKQGFDTSAIGNYRSKVPQNGLDTAGYRSYADTAGLEDKALVSGRNMLSKKADSLKTKEDHDSLYSRIKACRDKIEFYAQEIARYRQAMNTLNSNDPSALAAKNSYLGRAQSFLSKVKRFEVGLCYPNYSTFLINNLTLNGINAEYASDNYFVNMTYGKTVTNYLVPGQTSNSIINKFQSYGNFFDFSNNSDARKIAAAKIGVGNRSKSYLAFGALYGMGKDSYFSPSSTTSLNETNLVYELDGNLQFKGYNLFGSFAKSFIRQQGVVTDNTETGGSSDANRNNAMQLKFTGVLPVVKTKFSLGYRLIDPFFKSYGVGFLRSDNIRYEAKLEQVLSPKLKLTGSYRRDEDNILKRYTYKASLQTLTLGARAKLLKKRLDLTLNYSPIVQTISNFSDHSRTLNKSDMKNVVVSYTPKLKHFACTITALYNQYSLYDSLQIKNLETMSLSVISSFKNRLRLSAASSYFNTNLKDTTSTPNTIISSLEANYTFKNNMMAGLGAKHSYNTRYYNHQVGGSATVNIPLKKWIYLELHAERLIIGDFYTSLNVNNINRFPYYCYTKLNLKF